MAALSVIGVNCVNAKRVVDKAAEFINTLEMRSKSPFLKGCLQKLAILAGDEKVIEAIKDGRRGKRGWKLKSERSSDVGKVVVKELTFVEALLHIWDPSSIMILVW